MPTSGLQIRIVQSSEQETNCGNLGFHATAFTRALCPANFAINSSELCFHTYIHSSANTLSFLVQKKKLTKITKYKPKTRDLFDNKKILEEKDKTSR